MAKSRQPIALWLLYDMARDQLSSLASIDTIRHTMSFLCGYELKDWEVEDLLNKIKGVNKAHKIESKLRIRFENTPDMEKMMAEREKARQWARIDALITKSVRYNLSYKHTKKKLNSS